MPKLIVVILMLTFFSVDLFAQNRNNNWDRARYQRELNELNDYLRKRKEVDRERREAKKEAMLSPVLEAILAANDDESYMKAYNKIQDIAKSGGNFKTERSMKYIWKVQFSKEDKAKLIEAVMLFDKKMLIQCQDAEKGLKSENKKGSVEQLLMMQRFGRLNTGGYATQIINKAKFDSRELRSIIIKTEKELKTSKKL